MRSCSQNQIPKRQNAPLSFGHNHLQEPECPLSKEHTEYRRKRLILTHPLEDVHAQVYNDDNMPHKTTLVPSPAYMFHSDKWHVHHFVLGMILFIGVVLRCAVSHRLGLWHFDEGVYALSGQWPFQLDGTSPFYVNHHYYAPSLLPGLIGISFYFLGIEDLSAIAVSQASGCILIFATYWIASRWYDRSTALIAASLAMFSEMHIIYSRMALTDSLLVTCFVVSLVCISEMLSQCRYQWSIASGIAVTLAWNTKYNGWLPLFFGLCGFMPTIVRNASLTLPLLKYWCLATGIAVLGYMPWYLYISQQPGGYPALINHHQGYLVGWQGWLSSLNEHVNHLTSMHSELSVTGLAVTCFVIPLLANAWTIKRVILSSLVCIAIYAIGSQTNALYLMFLFSISALTIPLVEKRIRKRPLEHQPILTGNPGPWIHIGWVLGLLILTPLYTPYPRLTLAWLPGIWIATGKFISFISHQLVAPTTGAAEIPTARRLPVILLLSLIFVSPIVTNNRAWLFWSPTNHIQKAARQLDSVLPPESRIYVYAEPSLLFYLRKNQRRAVAIGSLSRILDLPEQSTTEFLVLGPHAFQDPTTKIFLNQQLLPRLKQVLHIPFSQLTHPLISAQTKHLTEPYLGITTYQLTKP